MTKANCQALVHELKPGNASIMSKYYGTKWRITWQDSARFEERFVRHVPYRFFTILLRAAVHIFLCSGCASIMESPSLFWNDNIYIFSRSTNFKKARVRVTNEECKRGITQRSFSVVLCSSYWSTEIKVATSMKCFINPCHVCLSIHSWTLRTLFAVIYKDYRGR